MNIRFMIAGQSLSPSDLDDDSIPGKAKATMSRVRSMLLERLDGIGCPVHGQEATAIVAGPSYQQLGLELKTCCEEFLKTASARLEPPQEGH